MRPLYPAKGKREPADIEKDFTFYRSLTAKSSLQKERKKMESSPYYRVS